MVEPIRPLPPILIGIDEHHWPWRLSPSALDVAISVKAEP